MTTTITLENSTHALLRIDGDRIFDGQTNAQLLRLGGESITHCDSSQALLVLRNGWVTSVNSSQPVLRIDGNRIMKAHGSEVLFRVDNDRIIAENSSRTVYRIRGELSPLALVACLYLLMPNLFNGLNQTDLSRFETEEISKDVPKMSTGSNENDSVSKIVILLLAVAFVVFFASGSDETQDVSRVSESQRSDSPMERFERLVLTSTLSDDPQTIRAVLIKVSQLKKPPIGQPSEVLSKMPVVEELFNERNFNKANATLAQLIKISPSDAHLRANYAYSLYKVGDYEASLYQSSVSLVCDVRHTSGWKVLRASCQKLGRQDCVRNADLIIKFLNNY